MPNPLEALKKAERIGPSRNKMKFDEMMRKAKDKDNWKIGMVPLPKPMSFGNAPDPKTWKHLVEPFMETPIPPKSKWLGKLLGDKEENRTTDIELPRDPINEMKKPRKVGIGPELATYKKKLPYATKK